MTSCPSDEVNVKENITLTDLFHLSERLLLRGVGVDYYGYRLKGSLRPCLPICRQRLTKVLVSIRTMPFVKLIISQKISMVSNIGCPLNIKVGARYFTKPLAHKHDRNTKLS